MAAWAYKHPSSLPPANKPKAGMVSSQRQRGVPFLWLTDAEIILFQMAGTLLALLVHTALHRGSQLFECMCLQVRLRRGYRFAIICISDCGPHHGRNIMQTFTYVRFMNELPRSFVDIQHPRSKQKIAHTESEIMKWKKMFCCFEPNFPAGRKTAAKTLHGLCITSKASWKSLFIYTGRKCFI